MTSAAEGIMQLLGMFLFHFMPSNEDTSRSDCNEIAMRSP